MQTFLCEDTFAESILHLDNRRLGKQRVEAKQIYDILTGNTGHWKNPNAWANHPAVRMWRGHESALADYYDFCILEWKHRGFNNNMNLICNLKILVYPPWYNQDLINSHRSNLLRKDYKYYSQFNWNVPDNLPYVWPV